MDLILAKKRVLLLVSGGIAIYKSLDLISALKKEGAEIFVVMSEEATRFIAPLTFEAMSGNKVLCRATESFPQISHISYANLADIAIIVPATINTIAKLNYGIADNLIIQTLLACKCAVFIAPSANINMIESPQNKANLDSLRQMGYKIIPPRTTLLACNVVANGAMAEVSEIIFQLKRGIVSENSSLGASCGDLANFECSQTTSLVSHSKFAKNTTTSTANTRICDSNKSNSNATESSLRWRITDSHEAIQKNVDCHESANADSRNDKATKTFWRNKNIIITGGSSVESIDSIRHISNDSSGKQASNLALAFYYLGANVTLIASKFPLTLPLEVKQIAVKSSADFKNAIESTLQNRDSSPTAQNDEDKGNILLMAAAISDYVPTQREKGKLKKEQIGKEWSLNLTQNEDILKQISNKFGDSCYIVGFKAESFGEQITQETIKDANLNAKKMLKNKNCDMVVLNIIHKDNKIGGESNEVRIFTAQDEVQIKRDSKLNISFEIAKNIAQNISKK